MASLIIRKLSEKTITRVRIRAPHHGVSMEEETRQIIKKIASTPENPGDLALKYFGVRQGVDLRCQNVSHMNQ